MLHIKLKGMEHINIVLTYTLHPRVEVKTFSGSGHVAYQIKRKEV